MISKLVEVIMLDRIEMYIITNPNQFGFKRKHGTDQCIYVLKEIIDLYRKLAGYPASLETLSPGISAPPSLVPLSPLSYSSLPSTLPPSDYSASLRITAFPRYFLNLEA